MRGKVLVFSGLIMGWSASVSAQTVACGIDCADRAYRSCNDSASLRGAALPISCSASAGSCTGEIFCASLGHQLPSSAFPVDIEELLLVAADAQPTAAAMPFDLIVYEELGTALPGNQIGPVYTLSIPGSQTAAIRIDLTSGGFSPIRVPNAGPFRVCLRKQFDGGHNVCLDTNGTSAAARNWTFVRVAANPTNPCGPVLLPGAWYAASGAGSPIPGFPGLSGDFILRAKVRPTSLTGVPGWAGCIGADAGIADSSPADGPSGDANQGPTDEGVIDVGPSDTGSAPGDAEEDLGSELDAAEDLGAQDTGASADAASSRDSGAPPVDAGAESQAPTITAVTPTSGREGEPLSLLVTGRGFVDGLEMRLGTIIATDVSVTGETTAQGTVAGTLEPGSYALAVINPDGQAAILAAAVTITGAAPAPPASDSCRSTAAGSGVPALLAALGLVFVARRRRRIGPRHRIVAAAAPRMTAKDAA